MTYFYLWMALCAGVVIGFVLAALLRANDSRYPAPSATVTVVSPQAQARIGEALSHAGDMLQGGDFEYLSGGLMVRDVGHGVVNISGDLSLRAVEHE